MLEVLAAENINLVNVRAIINLVIVAELLVLLLVPLTAELLIQVVRLVVMTLVRAVIQKQNPVNVTIQRPPAAEIPVTKQKNVRRNGEHVPDWFKIAQLVIF